MAGTRTRPGGKVIVCRCEDVTLGEVEHAMALGYRDIEEVKRYTGLGTGVCGGKECMSLCAHVLRRGAGEASQSTVSPSRASAAAPFTARPPIQTVTLGTLAGITPTTLVGGKEPR